MTEEERTTVKNWGVTFDKDPVKAFRAAIEPRPKKEKTFEDVKDILEREVIKNVPQRPSGKKIMDFNEAKAILEQKAMEKSLERKKLMRID